MAYTADPEVSKYGTSQRVRITLSMDVKVETDVPTDPHHFRVWLLQRERAIATAVEQLLDTREWDANDENRVGWVTDDIQAHATEFQFVTARVTR